jgi:uncharacterized membrane-anchored protein YitT (DUF2179 family)
MKKLTLIIALFLISLNAFSQDLSIFDKYEDNNEVTTVVVTKQAFLLLQKVSGESKEAQEYKKLVNGLNELKVFTTENSKISQEMIATFDSYIKSKKMVELMRVKDKEAHVKIYTRQGKDADHISEFIMLVDEMNVTINRGTGSEKPELVIVSLTGDINLNDIAKITSEMNIPGNEHVKDAKK